MKKRSKIIIWSMLGLFILSIILIPYLLSRGKGPLFEFVEIKRGELKQEVSSTGKAKPAQSVNLSFEKQGKVAAIFVKVGQQVSSGQALVRLNSNELQAQVNQYQAILEREQISLTELKQGARQEEVDIAETNLAKAQQQLIDKQAELAATQNKAEIDLANTYNDVEDVLQAAYTEADDAVNKQVDDLFNNDSSDSPSLTFSTTDNAKKSQAEQYRVLARDSIIELDAILNQITDSYTDLDNALILSEGQLDIIREFLNKLTSAVNVAAGLSQTTINTYKGYVNTARDNVNTALSNVNNQAQIISAQKATNQNSIAAAKTAFNTAKNSLIQAQDELNLKLAGATSEQIQAQEAQINVAKANLQNAQAQLSRMILYSPISGTITKQEAKIGEIISVNANVVSIISASEFEVEVFIPEVDIAKIALNNPAEITLDAYGDDIVFSAVVSSIAPAETVIEGVSTYKTILQFIETDSRIKSGMTANIKILSALKQNVITAPYRAVTQQNGDYFIKVLTSNKNFKDVQVKTGLRGSDGNIEIIEGLKPGDKVITYIEE